MGHTTDSSEEALPEYTAVQGCSEATIHDKFVLADLSEPVYTPFHVVTLVIFICAILHTFFANKFTKLAHRLAERHTNKKLRESLKNPAYYDNPAKEKSFAAEICHFLGEVEVIFGIWVIPILIAAVFFYNWDTAVSYINHANYTEAIFVVVIMCLAATKPIVSLAENSLKRVARFFGDSVSAQWFTILTIGPILGSFITEAGAMTLAALLLGRQVYEYGPSKKLAYATIGLLFVNISVGGILTNFAAPPVLIISQCWNWTSLHMLSFFGWKTVVGILTCNSVYWIMFRKEFTRLQEIKLKKAGQIRLQPDTSKQSVPAWVTLVHVFLLIWLVINEHDPPIFIGSFLLFLGFYQATSPHQFPLNLKRPILVGFFLAGLVIHGGLQGWWIIPVLGQLKEGAIMAAGATLTAFNDNAAVTYLSSLVPTLTPDLKHAVVSGVVVGGGLTVIANAPNPAGQMLLRKYFRNGVSPFYLFLAALLPTCIFYALFYFSLHW